jgi:hypothetical protein
MTKKRLLLLTLALLLVNLCSAKQTSAQGRLNDLAARLASEANEFADASYRPYSTTLRENRSVAQAAMMAHQFNGGARFFQRMVIDRARRNELREAFNVLQSLATPIDGNNVQPARWQNIQRLISDIASELSYNRDDRDRDNDDFPSQSGRVVWKGRVDDDIRIVIRGGTADVETIGGTPYSNSSTNFSASLPRRRVNVRLQIRKGRGEAFIEQQPSRENDFAAVIRIRDSRGGASDYEIEVSW